MGSLRGSIKGHYEGSMRFLSGSSSFKASFKGHYDTMRDEAPLAAHIIKGSFKGSQKSRYEGSMGLQKGFRV